MTASSPDASPKNVALLSEKDAVLLTPARVLRWHVAIVGVLVAASVLGDVIYLVAGYDTILGYRPLFNMDMEWNVPTLFSGLAVFLSAFLLFSLAWKYRQAAIGDWRYLVFLGLIFLFLAYDETFSVHERLIPVLQEAVTDRGMFHHAWIIAGIPFAIAVGLLSIGFLRRTDSDLRNLLILSGAIFCAGAIGLEALGGWRVDALGDDYGRGRPDALYFFLATLEEALEMLGIALFIYTLLLLYRRKFGPVTIRIE